jgi:hypothetical protein
MLYLRLQAAEPLARVQSGEAHRRRRLLFFFLNQVKHIGIDAFFFFGNQVKHIGIDACQGVMTSGTNFRAFIEPE